MADALCRFCAAPLTHLFVDLGEMPLANAYLADAHAAAGERRYPLRVMVCGSCLLVQVEHAVSPEAIFAEEYAYLSSVSRSWVDHARRYAEAMIVRYGLGANAMVVEVASNDGYLLRHFRDRGITVLGVEPARNIAAMAEADNIPTEAMFFDTDSARILAGRGIAADLMVANNVLAHVPDIRGFIAGFPLMLKPEGVATFEFPHLLNLIEGVQFDTIYHEHYSYLSLHVVEQVLASAGLRVFDVEELPTHGGSLRVHACHDGAAHKAAPRLAGIRAKEHAAGLASADGYSGFAPRAEAVRGAFLAFLAEARASGRTIAGYGAAAKGNTFLNYCGVTTEDLLCVVDRNREKQGRLLPGSHVPVRAPEALAELKPDYVLILPWNLADEIVETMRRVRDWGGRFVVAVPELREL